MFIFINATEVHSFLLQPKKLDFTPIGEYKMQGYSQRRGRRGEGGGGRPLPSKRLCPNF